MPDDRPRRAHPARRPGARGLTAAALSGSADGLVLADRRLVRRRRRRPVPTARGTRSQAAGGSRTSSPKPDEGRAPAPSAVSPRGSADVNACQPRSSPARKPVGSSSAPTRRRGRRRYTSSGREGGLVRRAPSAAPRATRGRPAAGTARPSTVHDLADRVRPGEQRPDAVDAGAAGTRPGVDVGHLGGDVLRPAGSARGRCPARATLTSSVVEAVSSGTRRVELAPRCGPGCLGSVTVCSPDTRPPERRGRLPRPAERRPLDLARSGSADVAGADDRPVVEDGACPAAFAARRRRPCRGWPAPGALALSVAPPAPVAEPGRRCPASSLRRLGAQPHPATPSGDEGQGGGRAHEAPSRRGSRHGGRPLSPPGRPRLLPGVTAGHTPAVPGGRPRDSIVINSVAPAVSGDGTPRRPSGTMAA